MAIASAAMLGLAAAAVATGERVELGTR